MTTLFEMLLGVNEFKMVQKEQQVFYGFFPRLRRPKDNFLLRKRFLIFPSLSMNAFTKKKRKNRQLQVTIHTKIHLLQKQ